MVLKIHYGYFLSYRFNFSTKDFIKEASISLRSS